eukprot:64714_1
MATDWHNPYAHTASYFVFKSILTIISSFVSISILTIHWIEHTQQFNYNKITIHISNSIYTIRYACKWGQYSNETTDPEHLERIQNTDELSTNRKIHYLFEPEMERVEFKGKPRRSTIDGAIIKTDDELQKIKNYRASYGLLLIVIISICGLSITIV